MHVLMTVNGNGTAGNVHQDLELEIGAGCIGDYGLETVYLPDQEFLDAFLNPGAVLFVGVPLEGVVKALVDENSEFGRVIKLLDFLDENQEGRVGFD